LHPHVNLTHPTEQVPYSTEISLGSQPPRTIKKENVKQLQDIGPKTNAPAPPTSPFPVHKLSSRSRFDEQKAARAETPRETHLNPSREHPRKLRAKHTVNAGGRKLSLPYGEVNQSFTKNVAVPGR
jgi:hypothetical protein